MHRGSCYFWGIFWYIKYWNAKTSTSNRKNWQKLGQKKEVQSKFNFFANKTYITSIQNLCINTKFISDSLVFSSQLFKFTHPKNYSKNLFQHKKMKLRHYKLSSTLNLNRLNDDPFLKAIHLISIIWNFLFLCRFQFQKKTLRKKVDAKKSRILNFFYFLKSSF